MRKYIKYMIHTCIERERYAKDILVPSLVAQGIKKGDIYVWNDTKRVGNLEAFVESCEWIGETQDPNASIWHLQDDIVPSKRFKEVTERKYSGIANGFCNEQFEGGRTNCIGNVDAPHSWFSHVCKLIPNDMAVRFADWYRNDCVPNKLFTECVSTGKCDDSLFREYVLAHESNVPVTNLFPNIIDHIDFLIGGTVINKQRKGNKRQAYWRDEALDEAVEDLKGKLEMKD